MPKSIHAIKSDIHAAATIVVCSDKIIANNPHRDLTTVCLTREHAFLKCAGHIEASQMHVVPTTPDAGTDHMELVSVTKPNGYFS